MPGANSIQDASIKLEVFSFGFTKNFFFSIFRNELFMLTETQKEYIVLLKLSGLESKQIALKSGVPYETVKKHLERHPAFAQEGYCINCGKAFHLRKGKKFCSCRPPLKESAKSPNGERRRAFDDRRRKNKDTLREQ